MLKIEFYQTFMVDCFVYIREGSVENFPYQCPASDKTVLIPGYVLQ